ncbi:MAG: transglutaminase TgpA family protein [Planctomycetota bacterium]|jgi:transglutaminase-like putative cysteine protease
MKLLRTFPILAYAVVLLSIVGVGVATESPALLLVCGALAAMSWYVTEGPRGRSLPLWTANALVVAVLLHGVVDLARHPYDVMGVLARFIVWLTLIKLYQQKSPRDYAQILGLSLLVMLIGALRSPDLLFAAVLLLYAVLGLYALLLFQLYAAHERTRSDRLQAIPAGYGLLPSLQPIVGRRTALHLRSLTAAVTAAGLAASMILFVSFPRSGGEGSTWGVPVPGASQAAFATEVDLLSSTRITGSRRIALELSLSGDRAGLGDPVHLRGAVLDRYQGDGRWTSTAGSRHVPVATGPPGLTWLGRPEPGPDLPDVGSTLTMAFEVLSAQSMLFSAYVPVAIGTDERRELRFDPLTQTLEDASGDRLLRYRIKADPTPSDATLQALSAHFGPADGGSMVDQFREFDSRVAELARGILADQGISPAPPAAEDDRWAWHAVAADALTEYLRATDTSHLTYSTDLSAVEYRSDGREDPIAQFLFSAQRGHCEYFASALAAMCNCVGVPARLVTGYVANELGEAGGVYIVRESDAHAWVEVQVSPWRWRAFDPTPQGELDSNTRGMQHSLADRWRWLFDRFEARWIDGFVAFDSDRQERLLAALDGGWSQRLSEALHATQQWLASVNRAFYFGPAGYIWMGIVALAVVIAAIAVGTRMRRAARLRATTRLGHVRGGVYHRMLWQLGFYLDMLEALDQAGMGKPGWQPPLQYAEALAGRNAEGASLVRQLTELFYAARYGGRHLSREELSGAQSLVEQLRRTMHHPGP